MTLDLDFVSIPRGVVGGGKDTTWKWGGSSELTLNLDFNKLGLWPGAFFQLRAESAFKHNVVGNSSKFLVEY